jgi:DNA-binding Lrp family transcriptional regulator
MQLNSENKLNKQQLTMLEKHLLNDFQHGFPLVSRPYEEIAKKLGTSENIIIESLAQLKERGFISRVGAVFRANSIGARTLAAISVAEDELESIASIINEYSEVNHNYKREHHFNLWFVLTASGEHELNAVLDDIEQRTGYSVMYLPMIEDFHIDLGFDLEFELDHDLDINLEGVS